jgi:hypothetical protein
MSTSTIDPSPDGIESWSESFWDDVGMIVLGKEECKMNNSLNLPSDDLADE